MDGVLFDTESIDWNAWRTVAKNRGFTITDRALESMCSASNEMRRLKIEESAGPGLDIDELIAEQRVIYREGLAQHLAVKKGARELITYLKRKGYRTAVASSASAARINSNLERSGLGGYFDAVLSGEQMERYKPAPDIYLAAAKAIGLPPASCLAVEDSRNGLLSAVAAGCVTVMVPDMTPPDEEIRGMVFAVLDNLMDVTRLLEKMPSLC